MERLTERSKYNETDISIKWEYQCNGYCTQYGDCRSDCDCITAAIRRLAEYEDLEEQGRLLRLPCEVGDTVYCIYSRYTKCSEHNREFEESSCLGCEAECDSKKEYYIQEQKAYSLKWIVTQMMNKHFGKLVFLTQAEAEQALQERNGDEENVEASTTI